MSMRDAMNALGVFAMQEPTPDKVQQVFRRLSLKYHPDKGGDPVKFNRLVEARRVVLSDWDLAIAMHQQDQCRKAEELRRATDQREAERKVKRSNERDGAGRVIGDETISDKVARVTMCMDAFNVVFNGNTNINANRNKA
jgi:DnaJ-class molecular chaperone